MGDTDAAAKQGLAADSSRYVRFIVLGDQRTGSTMLVQALNSSPRITCFREVFNGRLDFIPYGVEGYDDFSPWDIALRKDDPARFLHERIFCRHPEEIRAVGFKLHYGHHWDFPGILEELANDRELRVLHLRRRNLLRQLVSSKIAQSTGVWLEEGRPGARLANVLKALRHPLKAARRVPRFLRRMRPPKQGPRARVTIAPEECRTLIMQSNIRVANYDELFREHPKVTVFYEDILKRREDVFNEAQSFLDVEPQPLTVSLRQQNPEPLRELIENYDELCEAYKDGPHVWMFE